MPWPPDADLLEAWLRLCDDPTAFGAFSKLALVPLADALTAKFRTADEQDLFDAATDALLAFRKHPERYNPTISPLTKYLLLIARRRLSNILTAGRKHREGRIPWDSVELDVTDRNEVEDDDLPSLDDPKVQAALAKLSDVDRRVFDLMFSGERRNEVFAPLLGLTDSPVDEQRRSVKKAKDRILARLRRAVGGSDDG